MSDRPGLGLRYGAPVWLGLLGLALALRAYHLPGFVVNNDEGHWLLYALLVGIPASAISEDTTGLTQ